MGLRSVSLALALAAASPLAAATLGPSPYLSFADSPFAPVSFQVFVLQTFDSAGLDTSTVTASGGIWLNFGNLIDSVGGGGSVPGSWYSNGNQTIRFDFTSFQTVHGKLPTHAGMVWTDIGFRLSDGGIGGPSPLDFRWQDGNGNVFLASTRVGDAFVAGETPEDRFFGAKSNAGIRWIEFTMPDSIDWELDHLQYGLVPEPGTWAMLIAGFGLVGAGLRRRRSLLAA